MNRSPSMKHRLAAACAAFVAIVFAMVTLPPIAKAQVTIGLPGTLYFGSHYPSFVTDQPCHSYVIDLVGMEAVYPELVAKLEALRPGPVDLTLSLQTTKSITPDGGSAFFVTSVTARTEGARDVGKLCTSKTPGGYYEGILLTYNLKAWYGNIQLGLPGNRRLYLDFSPKEPPRFGGRPLLCSPNPEKTLAHSCAWPSALKIGSARVRVFLNNRVDPNGDTSQVPTRVELAP